MKKMKIIYICQIAIFLAALSIAISIVVSYWVYKENEYQLYKLCLEMQANKNAAMMSEYEDPQLQLNEMVNRCRSRNY